MVKTITAVDPSPIFAGMLTELENKLRKHRDEYHPVILLHDNDLISALDLSENGVPLTPAITADSLLFSEFMDQLRAARGASYLAGGYNELREMYNRSSLFDEPGEPRRLHLGTDIWGPAGSVVYAFMGGMVHSIGYNEGNGNYGATLILLHQLEGQPFYTLYGHISKADIADLSPGQYVNRGQIIAHFGVPSENGNWPSHLHLQIIQEIGMFEGDFPGVCKYSERVQWLTNCPDPESILQLSNRINQPS